MKTWWGKGWMGKGRGWCTRLGGGRSAISGSALKRAWWVLWGVRTIRRGVCHFFVEVKVFFGRKIRKIQKEWRLKKEHSLFKSSTAVKWRDMTFMRSNVCLPKHKKRRGTKMARSTLLSHVSVLNIARHDYYSVNAWTNVTVKGLCH